MDREYVEKNKSEYLRLKKIIDGLTSDEWRIQIDNDWSVGSMLTHLAFWDKMTFERINSWKIKGSIANIPDSETIDAINSSVMAISGLLDFKSGISFVLSCAEEVDEMVARLALEDINFLKDSGKERWFMRYLHRSMHLNKIEKALVSYA